MVWIIGAIDPIVDPGGGVGGREGVVGGVLESAAASEGNVLEDLRPNYLWCFVLRKLCNRLCRPGQTTGSERVSALARQLQLGL